MVINSRDRMASAVILLFGLTSFRHHFPEVPFAQLT
jgi:hypothetical protein